MADQPIKGLMDSAMGNIKSMIDVNTIVGDPVTTPDGTVIIPISKVTFGFGAAGTEFRGKYTTSPEQSPMFGGGCGGGAKVNPVAFLIVGNGTIKLLPATGETSSVEKLTDLIPEIFEKVNGVISSVSEKISKRKKDKEKKTQETDVKIDITEEAE